MEKINRPTLICLLAILLVALAIYANCLSGKFLNWDDQLQITNNGDIANFSWSGFKKIFSNIYLDMYQPLPTSSFALELKLWQANPFFFHLDNILLHLINIILVFWLTKLLFGKNRLALITAALFAWHPLMLESVAWISARSTTLYALFFLSALIAYWQHLKRNQLAYYWLALILFALALLSKTLAVSLPLVLLLLDYHYYKKINFKIILKKLPFLALAIGIGLIAIKTRVTVPDFYTASLQYPWYNIGLTYLYSLGFYLDKLLLPNHLSVFVTYPLTNSNWLPLSFYLVPLELVLVATALIIWRRQKIILLAGAWYLANLLFTIPINSFSKTLVADRYVYLAGLGVFWLVAAGFEKLQELWPNLKIFFLLTLFSYLALLGLITFNRTSVWQNDFNLWQDASASAPQAAFVYVNIGNAERSIGDTEAAKTAYQKAVEILPNNSEALNGLGLVYFDLKDYLAAINYFNQAIVNNQRDPLYYYNRGCALIAVNNQTMALVDYNLAISLSEANNTHLPTYWTAAANTRYKLGDFAGAWSDYDQALKLQPSISQGYFFRGLSKIKLKQIETGCQDLREADKLGYSDAQKDYNKLCNNK